MVSAEKSRYSYIRAVREVEPSLQLKKFVARAMHIGSVVLGYEDSTFLELPLTPAEELHEGLEPIREGIGLAAALIYPAHRLRYTHFERLARPEEGMNKAISRVYARVTEGDSAQEKILRLRLQRIREKYKIRDDSQLIVRVVGAAVSTKPQYQHLGEEYALSLADGPVVQAMTEYDYAIFQYLRNTAPGSQLCRGQHPSEKILIPFARLPLKAEESQREEFEYRIIENLFHQPLQVGLGPIEWESRVR